MWRSISHASARRYTLFKVTSIDELDARTSSCNDYETALTNPIEYIYISTQMAEIIIYYWPNIGLQAAIQLIVRELCTLSHAEQFSIECCTCDMCSFFSKNTSPEEREQRKMRRSLRRENKISWCIVIVVDVCNTRGHSVSCKMQRKSCMSHFFFLTETSSAENKASVYLIFLPTCLQELTRGHHLISIHGTLPLT